MEIDVNGFFADEEVLGKGAVVDIRYYGTLPSFYVKTIRRLNVCNLKVTDESLLTGSFFDALMGRSEKVRMVQCTTSRFPFFIPEISVLRIETLINQYRTVEVV